MNKISKPTGKIGNKLPVAKAESLITSNMNVVSEYIEPETKSPKITEITKESKLPLESVKRKFGLDRESIFRTYVPEDIDGSYISRLLDLRYDNNDLKIQEKDVIIEVIGMLKLYTKEYVLEFLEDAPNKEWIFWEQEFMNIGKVSVEREIFMNRAEEVGVKGVGKCRFCSGKELVFDQKQVNSGDEPMKVYVRCVTCNQHWKQG